MTLFLPFLLYLLLLLILVLLLMLWLLLNLPLKIRNDTFYFIYFNAFSLRKIYLFKNISLHVIYNYFSIIALTLLVTFNITLNDTIK